jgi:phosphoribosylaminoimidazole carboxylase (NCAIR synthetase)
MVNILGEDIDKFKDITDAAIHMYGKEEVLPGRKMGHVNYSSQKNKTFYRGWWLESHHLFI